MTGCAGHNASATARGLSAFAPSSGTLATGTTELPTCSPMLTVVPGRPCTWKAIQPRSAVSADNWSACSARAGAVPPASASRLIANSAFRHLTANDGNCYRLLLGFGAWSVRALDRDRSATFTDSAPLIRPARFSVLEVLSRELDPEPNPTVLGRREAPAG